MKPLQKLMFLLLLTGMAGISFPITAQTVIQDNQLYTLYPPLNFAGTAIECSSYLHWDKPQLPGGGTPSGLAGYYIYRDGIMSFYVSSGETLSYYDYILESGTFSYTITANYDLTSYGVPGQFGESPPAGPISVLITCPVAMPFYEPWDAGTFTFQNWQFIPAQGNWTMNTGEGNPAPAAYFNGIPSVQDYDFTMRSITLPFEPWVCADIYLEFDYKLNDIAAGGTEKLTAEYFMDNTWIPVLELKNEGSTGWIHQKLDISQVSGKRCKLGFKVSGANSANITSWAVDNIRLSPVCKGPAGCDYTKSGNVVHLFWQPPACDSLQYLSGYNIYRTNEDGIPPFNKINGTPVANLEYDDQYPASITSAHFRYIITAIHRNPADNTVLCEAPCDTLVVDYVSGISIKGKTGLTIRTIPGSDQLEIHSDSPVESCEVLNCLGQYQFSVKSDKQTEFTIPVSGLSNGIYLVKIKNASGSLVKKVTVMH
jgi:hypothetical protein